MLAIVVTCGAVKMFTAWVLIVVGVGVAVVVEKIVVGLSLSHFTSSRLLQIPCPNVCRRTPPTLDLFSLLIVVKKLWRVASVVVVVDSYFFISVINGKSKFICISAKGHHY